MTESDLEQLKRRVATEVMGYSIYHYDKEKPGYYMLMDREYDPVNWRYPNNGRPTEDAAWGDCPDFTGSLDAARLVEDEIERRGIARYYTWWLLGIVEPGWYTPNDDDRPIWIALRATPEQRCRAALMAIGGRKQGKVTWDRGADEGRYTVRMEVRRVVHMPEAAVTDPMDEQRMRHYIRQMLGMPHPCPPSGDEIPIGEQQTLIIPAKCVK